jgi:hypothetical protein
MLPLQCAYLVALHRVDARRAVLDATNMEAPGAEFDLVPLQIADLRTRRGVSTNRVAALSSEGRPTYRHATWRETQMHSSLKPDPDLKGSYRRRIEDIDRAFKEMDADNLPAAARFLVRYFGCEKLAQGIVGIHNRWPPDKVYGPRKCPRLDQIKSAVTGLGLTFPLGDLAHLFEQHVSTTVKPLQEPISARDLRDAVVHNFGHTNVRYVHKKAPVLLPMMDRFLGCTPDVIAYLKAHFSKIQ